jgi:hypothetical protein
VPLRRELVRQLSGTPQNQEETLLCLTKMSFVLAVSIFPKYACLDSHSCSGPHSEQVSTGTRFGIDIKTGIGSREVEFRAVQAARRS